MAARNHYISVHRVQERKNYSKTKNKKTTTERLELKKFCPFLPQAPAAQGNQVN
jgi:ribosomal protein L33